MPIWRVQNHKRPRRAIDLMNRPNCKLKQVFLHSGIFPNPKCNAALSLYYRGVVVGGIREHPLSLVPLLSDEYDGLHLYDFEIAIWPCCQGGVGGWLLIKAMIERARRQEADFICTGIINEVLHKMLVKHFGFITLPIMPEDGDTQRFPYFARVCKIVSSQAMGTLENRLQRLANVKKAQDKILPKLQIA